MKVVRYHDDHGSRICIQAIDGHKYISVIPMDSAGIRVVRVPVKDKDRISEVQYSLAKAKQKFRVAGQKFGITKQAKQLLRGGA